MASYDRTGVTIRDTRDVTVQFDRDAPGERLVYTRLGHQPMRVHRVEIKYYIPDDMLQWVSAWGVLTEQRDLDAQERRGRTSGNRGATIERGLMGAWDMRGEPAANCPAWIRELIDAHYPGGPR